MAARARRLAVRDPGRSRASPAPCSTRASSAQAEAILESLPRDLGADGSEVRRVLELVYRFEGRMDDVRSLIVESWKGAADPPAVLRRLFVLDRAKYPAEDGRQSRGQRRPKRRPPLAGQGEPGDSERLPDEARRWLDRCKAKRPQDPAVWQAYLALARTTGDTAAAFDAMEQLPARRFSKADQLRLRAWIIGRSGDARGERDALNALLAEDPGDTAGWDRLAELALLAGRNRRGREISPAQGRGDRL